jgi:N-acetylglucosaminyl-diphospho-decaprenol L-rhamnosyltransferase
MGEQGEESMIPDLSFIIVEYHAVTDVRRFIDSLQEMRTDLRYEIIVSSNSSYPQEGQDPITGVFPGVKWIFNRRNLGFAGAVNAGIAHASGRCIVITNADVVFRNGNLSSAYQYLMSHPDVGIIGPKIVDAEGNIQDSCRRFMTPWRFSVRFAKRLLFRRDIVLRTGFDYEKIQPVDWVVGGFMMVKSEAVTKVGMMDDKYFLYVEDMDWCRSFREHGYKVVYFPELLIEYKISKKSVSPLVLKGFFNRYSVYHIKSYLRFLKKHGIKK